MLIRGGNHGSTLAAVVIGSHARKGKRSGALLYLGSSIQTRFWPTLPVPTTGITSCFLLGCKFGFAICKNGAIEEDVCLGCSKAKYWCRTEHHELTGRMRIIFNYSVQGTESVWLQFVLRQDAHSIELAGRRNSSYRRWRG